MEFFYWKIIRLFGVLFVCEEIDDRSGFLFFQFEALSLSKLNSQNSIDQAIHHFGCGEF